MSQDVDRLSQKADVNGFLLPPGVAREGGVA
jgi:hypothetical protein